MTNDNSLSLAGKVAIVTGSGKETGIGAGIAMTLARAGARVVINHVSDSTAPRAAKVAASIEAATSKGSAIVIQADVGSLEGVKKLVSETLSGLNVDHIDIIGTLKPDRLTFSLILTSLPVNNAVGGRPGPALAAAPEDVAKAFEVSVYGPLYLIQAAVSHMPRGSRIINIGSIASKLGLPGNPIYVASKAAKDALTFAMAQEVSRLGFLETSESG
jgi:NAD(P)-dependent dehydrogenase (short-subunit alcohol dehydrogenase family)